MPVLVSPQRSPDSKLHAPHCNSSLPSLQSELKSHTLDESRQVPSEHSKVPLLQAGGGVGCVTPGARVADPETGRVYEF